MPEAQVLSFDDYAEIGARLDAVLAGERRPAHQPRDRRRLLPIAPSGRRGAAAGHGLPGPVSGASGAASGAPDAATGAPARGSPPGIPDLPPGVAPASGPR